METPSIKDKDDSFPSSDASSIVNKLASVKYSNNKARKRKNDGFDDLRRSMSRASRKSTSRKPARWYNINWFHGMFNDVKRRAPWYWSDFTDAWDYRVVPSTVYVYFTNILPALAFSLDMFDRTDGSYGVNEVLLASVLGSVVFSLFAAQPLTIVGVTGPITVFSYTVYDIMVPQGTDFFAFMCLVGLWSMGMHFFLAISNSCNGLKYVTRFSCDTFGFYVACVYLEKGVQVLIRQYSLSATSGYLSIVVALLVFMFAFGAGILGESTLFQRHVRKFIEDYGTPLTLVFFTGFVYYGRMESVDVKVLPISKAFFPTADRAWLVNFWDIKDLSIIGSSFGFALVLTILFWFDHNVSSLIAQGSEFNLKKPAGFHWDIFLLGITTGVAGLLGIPFPNGLIPQAPFHTASLCVTRQESDPDDSTTSKQVVDHVVEQRLSNLFQGLLTLGTMTGPLLIVLHLIPQGVMAGLFFVMGISALLGNGMTQTILYLCRDRHFSDGALKQMPRQYMIWVFVGVQLFAFAVSFAITQTVAAVGFPVIFLLLIPLRSSVLPLWFTDEELKTLDEPTASPFTMESVGGQKGYEDESSLDDETHQNSSMEEKDFAGGHERDAEDAAERGEVDKSLGKRDEGR